MAGQGEEEGDKEDDLAGEGEEYRFAGFADRLEECGGHNLESDHPEGEHGKGECAGCDSYEGGVGGEGAGNVGGEG